MKRPESYDGKNPTSLKHFLDCFRQYKINYVSCLYFLVITFNLLLRANVPTRAAFLSPHDDQLGVEIASNILSGGWLGAWDSRTLAKPPGFSIYLAVAHYIPLQLVVLNQILYILVVLYLVRKLE